MRYGRNSQSGGVSERGECHRSNEKNFREEVLEADLPVLVDYWAVWCGYCSRLSPVIEELSEEMGGQVKFAKVDVDKNRSLAEDQGIQGLQR